MTRIAGSLAAELRHELSWRNREYARRLKLPHCESYGYPPAICYLPFEDRQGHGNFLPKSYQPSSSMNPGGSASKSAIAKPAVACRAQIALGANWIRAIAPTRCS
jgi:hypothetical protein